jgi:ADP-heptose:LPS heptosyltransferase
METPDKIVLEHTGALGDFLLAWPALLSVIRHFADQPAFHAVRPAHAHWLAPLANPCPPEVRRGLDARFAGNQWPQVLAKTLIVRPGLAVRPDVPENEQFLFLQGIVPGRWESPQTLYQEALGKHGIPFASDFAETFQSLFGGHAPVGDTALLFPGAGHPDKAWPLERFETLAGMLRAHGLRPVFVLGPVERERGTTPTTWGSIAPEDLSELAAAIRTARFVVGSDCGPMHLASLHGVPGVALFGPTAPEQWGPRGMTIVTTQLSCAPCTAKTSGEFATACPRPLPCLAGIDVASAWQALGRWLR